MKKTLLSCLLLLIYVAANAQLQNTDFEQWENPVDVPFVPNRPIGWIRSNGNPNSETYGFYHNANPDSQSGDYALKLSIWYNYDKDLAYQVAPINYRPTALTGYYKYTENQIYNNVLGVITPDMASATVYLTKWNDVLQQNDTIGSGELFLSESGSYSYFSCPITYTSSETPDTVKVILDCTLMKKGDEANGHSTANLGGVGSLFTVDNIALASALGGNPEHIQNISLYPNPVKDVLYIQSFDGDILIYDATGKLTITAANVSQNGIDTSKLQTGLYMVVMRNNKGVQHAKFIKN